MSEKKPWVAKIDNKNDRKEFEETRRCLLNSYHSYVQNHVGYLIVIIVGLVTLFSVLNSFLGNLLALVISSVITIPLVLRMVKRIFYWTSYATHAICMSLEEVKQLFEEYNSESKGYLEEAPAPYTAILQIAIWQKRKKDKNTVTLYKRLLDLY